ncbi:hypothetical protein [Desulfoluna sp.]|uniref:hypothetical protein n=1 Tax=Desulfoluna sp. TaxID=2045199 RepID=UPI0026236E8E|nr:hypothetical protein [Desulfoluna sp.]
MPEDSNKKPNKKKFKQTRQLVRMALNDGWTQETIAKKCRNHQSVVSEWSRGEKQGTEAQLKPLLEIYGNRLRRQSFKFYYSYDYKKETHTYFKVEGKILFTHTFFEEKSGYRSKEKRTKLKRLVVHDQGNSNFMIVVQERTEHHPSYFVECSDENGIWSSHALNQMNSHNVIHTIDSYVKEKPQYFPDEFISLPYLIRKAFLEHGYPVEGILEFPAEL